ncbi:MAG: hypothetical protein RR292_07350, partial [Christensenellaceae bacterium]
KVCKDSVLYEKMETLKKEEDQDKVLSETIKLAKEAGYTLCAKDFEMNEGEGEMDDAEMCAVAGGWCKCGCYQLGGGNADADGVACVCVVLGAGMRKDNANSRCVCYTAGYGYDLDLK